MGSTYLGRMGASFLSALNFPELICHSREEYEARAVDLALDPQELEDICARLEYAKKVEPLFNTRRWVRHLEKGFKKMWENYTMDILEDIEVDSIDNGLDL